MKEIKNIIHAYDKINFATTRAALATVVRVEGSSYRRTGARMLIMDDGRWVGGISGGCLEGDALRKAKHAIVQAKPTLITYDTTEDDAHQIGVGLGCNGIIDVLITPLNFADKNNPIEQLKNCIGMRENQIIVSVADKGKKVDVVEAGEVFKYENDEQFRQLFPAKGIVDDVLADIEWTLGKERSKPRDYEVANGHLTLFIELLVPEIHLALYGGNYDIYPLVTLAKEVGWKVSVVANPTKVNKSLFSTADHVISNKKPDVAIDDHTAIVLMSHDYATDLRNLKTLLKTDVPYIGLLGPRKRSEKMFTAMDEAGIDYQADLQQRIHAPIGLDIGAITPEEIAISIIAEVRAFFAGRSGGFLRKRKGTIHIREIEV
ncbi:MAG: XdhC family protein [Saprospiraceae bacterium]